LLAGIVGPIQGDRTFGQDLEHLIEASYRGPASASSA
jgi:hypothetical protein